MKSKVIQIAGLMFAGVLVVQAQEGIGYQKQQSYTASPWIVSVIHSTELLKLAGLLRGSLNAQVGVIGSATNTLNITTGLVIDDKGHVVTRLVTLDPKEKNPSLFVAAPGSPQVPAKLIGVDCASGFAVLEVESLKAPAPVFGPAAPLSDGAQVKMWTSNVSGKLSHDQAVEIVTTIGVIEGNIDTGSAYSKLRGAVGLRSERLRSRNDSSVVTSTDSRVIGMAQFAGFGRAYLYPINLIRDTVVQRVLERHDSVPSGWLGIAGRNSVWQKEPLGVFITEVQTGSPAEQSGLKAQDIIVGFDDSEIRNMVDLMNLLSASPVGRALKLRVVRDSNPMVVDAVLGACDCPVLPRIRLAFEQSAGQPLNEQLREMEKRRVDLQILYNSYQQIPNVRERQGALAEIQIELERLMRRKVEIEREAEAYGDNVGAREQFGQMAAAGFTFYEAKGQLASYFGRDGLLVTDVTVGSLAAGAGLRAGDLITGIIERENLPAARFKSLLLEQSNEFTLKVIRNRTEQVVVKLPCPAGNDNKGKRATRRWSRNKR